MRRKSIETINRIAGQHSLQPFNLPQITDEIYKQIHDLLQGQVEMLGKNLTQTEQQDMDSALADLANQRKADNS